MQVIKNKLLNEVVYKSKLSNGLDVYICKREGFEKKIGMFGTKYGSITNDFLDIQTGKRINVPDGIAHFLEHKLFEQEGSNALDLFSKEGISSNAYTSFDHTVYYFETIDKFNKGLEMLIKLVKTPYFTDDNVSKEQGIIGQEISMYENEPEYTSYFNALKCMYVNHPIRIDIAGTKESISNITKDILYTCYNTFYNPNNMFIVIVADVDVDETIKLIEDNLKIYEKDVKKCDVVKYKSDEPDNIFKDKNVQTMGIYMPQITLGYKMNIVFGNDLIKRQIVSEIVSEMYFSKTSKFYEEEYNNGNVSGEISFNYEGSDEFSHSIISISSVKENDIINNVKQYINRIKNQEIDSKLFNVIKRKKIGENLMLSESLTATYRRIIDSILNNSTLYYDIDILNSLTEKDVRDFLKELKEDRFVVSIVK